MSPNGGEPNAGKEVFDRAWALARFDRVRAGFGRPCGDHDLNPDLRPLRQLTSAAVLVPLVNHANGLTALFTQRTAHLAHHPGQISFPGGHMEPADATPEDTALRETEEEIGLPRRHVEVIGRLDQYVTRTGFSVTPVVAVIEPPFDLALDPHEVESVFEVPLAFFLDPANHQRHTRLFEGKERHFFAMPYGERYIWGATAGMLRNFYEIVMGR
ncbi:MAG: CoA pyrophosphatase [Rhodospirillales bacterium]|nr:CoA pyrophosphatase [Rhodospirillales bacterium]